MSDVELETVFGFNGAVPGGIHLLERGERILTPLGRALAISSLSDPHQQTFLRGHTDNISACALSTSASLLATGQKAEADILVFELDAGGRARQKFRFEEHEGTVVALAFTDDERVLLSAASDGTIFAWDLASGAIIARARQAENPTLAIVTGGFVNDVRGAPAALYQFATGGCSGITLWALEPVRGAMACERVSAVGISRDVTSLAFARPQPPSAAMHTHSHGLAYGHTGAAASSSVETAGDWLYGGTRSGDLVVAHVRSRAVAACVNVCTGGVTALSLAAPFAESDGGSLLLVGSGDGVVLLCKHTPPPPPSGGSATTAAGAGAAVGGGGGGRRGHVAGRSGSGAADTFAGWGEVAAGGAASASAVGSSSGSGSGSVSILATARVGGAIFSISVAPAPAPGPDRGGARAVTCLVASADGVLHRLDFAYAFAPPPGASGSAGVGVGPAAGRRAVDPAAYASSAASSTASVGSWRLTSQMVERQSHGAAHEGLPAAAPAFVALYPPPVLGPAPLSLSASSGGGAGAGSGSAGGSASASAGSGASAGAVLAAAPASLQAATRCPDVLAVAFPPGNSEVCVTAGNDACIRVWNLSDLACTATASAADAGLPVCLVAGRDGHISGWQDGAIRCWPHALRAVAPTHGRSPTGGAGSSSSSSGSGSSSSAASSAPLWFIADAHPAREGGVTALALASNERMLLSGGASGAIRLWDARTRALLSTFKEHASVIGQLQILPTDRLAVSASKDKILSTWDLASMRRLTVSLASASLTAVAVLPLPVASFASRGALSADDDAAPAFITCSVARLLEVWDARRREPLVSIPYPSGRGSSAATSPAGGHAPSLDVDPQATCIAVPHGRTDMLATGGTDGRLLFWSLPSFRLLSSHEVTAGAVRDVSFAPDDRQLIATSSDGGIHVYNVF